MDADRRERFKAQLQRQRAALLRQLPAGESVNASLGTRRELGTPHALCDRSRSTPTDGGTRQAIEAALARLAADSYGICTTCGREIALDRLELVPATPYCLRCARRRPRARGVTRFADGLGKLFCRSVSAWRHSLREITRSLLMHQYSRRPRRSRSTASQGGAGT